MKATLNRLDNLQSSPIISFISCLSRILFELGHAELQVTKYTNIFPLKIPIFWRLSSLETITYFYDL